MSIGVVIASLIIYINPCWSIADPICTYLFSIIVCLTVVKVYAQCFGVLMEAAPTALDVTKLIKDITAIDKVKAMHDFHVWSISVGKYALSAHITVDRDPMPVMKMAQ